MEYQDLIHKMVHSNNKTDQKNALHILVNDFEIFPNKERAWDDIYYFINQKDDDFSNDAMRGISKAVRLMPRESRYSIDIIKTIGIREEDYSFKIYQIKSFGYIFDDLNDDNKLIVLKYLLDLKSKYGKKYNNGLENDIYSAFLIKKLNSIPLSINVLDLCIRHNEHWLYQKIASSSCLTKKQFDSTSIWNYLIETIQSSSINNNLINLLFVIYEYIPDKEKGKDDIDKLINTLNNNPLRLQLLIATLTKDNIKLIQNKEVLWEFIVNNRSKDKNKYVLLFKKLELLYPLMPNKNSAWDEFYHIIQNDGYMLNYVNLESIFRWVPNKEKAWDDLYNLMLITGFSSESSDLHNDSTHLCRVFNLVEIQSIYHWMPNKEKVWDDLYNLISILNAYDRSSLLNTLKNICYLNLNKNKIWDDIFALSKIENTIITKTHESVDLDGHGEIYEDVILDLQTQLSTFLMYISESTPDKEKIWKDVCKAYIKESYNALYLLTSVVDSIENKIVVWDDTIKMSLLEHNDESVNTILLKIIKKISFEIENKDKIWNDLYRLLKTDNNIRNQISEIMSSIFKYVSDRDKAWDDLYLLAKTDNEDIRKLALDIMESVFYNVPTGSVKYAMEDLKELKYNNKIRPHITTINISEKQVECVRVAAIQINYELTKYFPFEIKKDHEIVKRKILSFIKKAKEQGANIICLPELCLSEKWLPEIQTMSEGVILIPGSFYNNSNQNICPIIMDNNKGIPVPPHIKINPSNQEAELAPGVGMVRGNTINIYNTKYGKFAVLICRDFLLYETMLLDVDMIFVISYNHNAKRYSNYAHNLVTDKPVFIIISNASDSGYTSIFAQLDTDYSLNDKDETYKGKNDDISLICRITEKKEGIIIADLNLNCKSIPKVNPNEANNDTRSIRRIRII